jgi:hypothetical protein
MKMLKRIGLSVVISLQMALQPLAIAYAETPNSQESELGYSAVLKPIDSWYISNQKILVYDSLGKTVQYEMALGQAMVQRPKFSYGGKLSPTLDENHRLVVDARRGANAKGQGGILVARQEIPTLAPAAAMTYDKELLMMVDQSGRVIATDIGALNHLFPVSAIFAQIDSLADLDIDFTKANVSVQMLTSGVAPFTKSDIYPGARMPFNLKGDPVLKAGDLLITLTASNGQRQILGVVPRGKTHAIMASTMEYLAVRAMLVKNSENMNARIVQRLAVEKSRDAELMEGIESLEERSAVIPELANAITALTESDIEFLAGRADVHRKLVHRERDMFGLDTWAERFKTLLGNARAQNPNFPVAEVTDVWQRLAVPGKKPYDSEDQYDTPIKEYYVQYAQIAGALAVMGGLGLIATNASPEVYQGVSMMDQAYLAATYYSSALRDATYVWYDMASVAVQSLAIPAIIGTSMAMGYVATAAGSMSADWKGNLGAHLRDLSRTWGPEAMNKWQRIVTAGNRGFASAVSAHIRLLEDKVGLNQKTLIASLTYGQNPFKRIQITSDEGETKTRFLGFNSWRLSKHELNSEALQKLAHISETVAKKDRLRSHAKILAAAAVYKEYGIDMSTLLLLESGKTPALADLRALYTDPKKKEIWELTTEQILKDLLKFPKEIREDIADISPAEIKEFYDDDVKAAKYIISLDPTRVLIKKLRIKSGKMAWQLWQGVLNLGRDHYSYLKGQEADRFTAGQTEKEYVSDTTMSTIFPALFGPRANGATSPEKLAATSRAPFFTSYQHMSDIAMNTIIHFFIAASRNAILYRTDGPELETNYDPYENIEHQTAMSKLSFAKSTWGWLKTCLSPFKGDLGGFIVNRQFNEFTIVQGYFLLSVATRMTLGHQSFSDADYGFWYFWLAGTWKFSWPWIPIGPGYKAYTNQFKERDAALTSARLKVLRSQRTETDNPEALLQKGLNELRALYGKYKPELLPALENAIAGKDLEKIVDLSINNAPFAKEASSSLNFWLNWAAALTTTAMAISLMVETYDADYHSIGTLAKWAGISTALTTLSYFLLSRDAWTRFDYLGKLRKLGLKSCADFLTPEDNIPKYPTE